MIKVHMIYCDTAMVIDKIFILPKHHNQTMLCIKLESSFIYKKMAYAAGVSVIYLYTDTYIRMWKREQFLLSTARVCQVLKDP